MTVTTRNVTAPEIRQAVAARYSRIGEHPASEATVPVGRNWAERLGYPSELLDTVPPAALASFTGIGAPVLQAELQPGERVLDLGCGAGLDSILAAQIVGTQGHVFSVDLAPGMVAATRSVVEESGLRNVTVIEAPAEHIPLPDHDLDVAVVNGLFNLSPDKDEVVAELRRALQPGGRVVGSEIVVTDDRPPRAYDPEDWFR